MSNFGPSTTLDPKAGTSFSGPKPAVDVETGVPTRAFQNAQQVSQFVTALLTDNNQRNIRNARITDKLNNERPWRQEELKQAGLAWKSNFTTRPLNTLVSKVVGRFPRAVNSARYLTASALPPQVPFAAEKTDFFRREFTLFLRAQPGWDDLVEGLSHETVLFGYTAAVAVNPDDVLPVPLRQDTFYVPAGTKQKAERAPVVVFSVDMSLHDAYRMLVDGQRAAAVGDERWDVDAFYDAINNALPQNSRLNITGEHVRQMADLNRQIQLGSSFVGSEKVRLIHVLVTELSGMVSHYILNGSHGGSPTGQLLFEHPDRFQSMGQVASFFAFEYGDGTMHGSKGLGRVAYAFASVIDRARNDAVDRLQLSGKIIAQGPDNNAARFKMNVVGNVMLISQEWSIQSTRIDSNVEASVALDDYLRGILDEMSGSYSPKAFANRDRVTRGEIDLLAAREGERADDVLLRWLSQFGAMVNAIQKRVLRADHKSPAVQQFRQKLLTRLTEEELALLTESPALSVVADWTETERMNIITAVNESLGNPLFDQKKLVHYKMSALVSPEFAKDVVIPDEDPTVAAEATRMQMLENTALGSGLPVPVSPRDNHLIHLQSMLPILESGAQTAAQDPGASGGLQFIVQHAGEHIAAAQAQGINDPIFEQIMPLLKQLELQVQEDMIAAQNAAPQPDATGAVV